MQALSCLLALSLAWPPGAHAAPAQEPARKTLGRAFFAGRLLDQVQVDALDVELRRVRDEARVIQDGRKNGESVNAFAERVRAVSRALELTDAEADVALGLYSRARMAPRAGAVRGEAPAQHAAVDSAITRAQALNARARDMSRALSAGTPRGERALGVSGTGAGAGEAMSAEALRRLNSIPQVQRPLSWRNTAASHVPAAPAATGPSWVDQQIWAGAQTLLEARGVPQDGSLGNWMKSRRLKAKGTGQVLMGKAVDGETYSRFRQAAGDFASYPRYAWSAAKAVGQGIYDDFHDVYEDGKALAAKPDAAKAADFTLSTSWAALNVIGLGTFTLARTASKALVKEGANAAAKTAAKTAIGVEGTGSLTGVFLTPSGERAAATLRALTPSSALNLKTVSQAGRTLYPSQNIANPRIIAEYAELMKSKKWDWARGAKIKLGVGPQGQTVIIEGHHRVLAAQAAGVDIPLSAFEFAQQARTPFRWNRIAWAGKDR